MASVATYPVSPVVDPEGQGATVSRLTPRDTERWDEFVNRCPDATFFHKAGWQQVIETAFGHDTHFLFAERDGEIIGVLPLGHIRSRLFGNALISTPFCVYGGIATQDPIAFSMLESAACSLAEKLEVDYLEMRNRERRHNGWPVKDLYVTFRKAIDPDNEVNLLAIPRKQRAMVRKGIKAGLEADFDSSVSRFFDAYSRSVHSLGTPVLLRKYFELLHKVFSDSCDILTITSKG